MLPLMGILVGYYLEEYPSTSSKDFQAVGCAAFKIASCLTDKPISYKDLVYSAANSFTVKHIEDTTHKMVLVLNKYDYIPIQPRSVSLLNLIINEIVEFPDLIEEDEHKYGEFAVVIDIALYLLTMMTIHGILYGHSLDQAVHTSLSIASNLTGYDNLEGTIDDDLVISFITNLTELELFTGKIIKNGVQKIRGY